MRIGFDHAYYVILAIEVSPRPIECKRDEPLTNHLPGCLIQLQERISGRRHKPIANLSGFIKLNQQRATHAEFDHVFRLRLKNAFTAASRERANSSSRG